MNTSFSTLCIFSFLMIIGLIGCTGSGTVNGQMNGRYETTSNYSSEETQNGQVVASKESHERNAGAFEDEFGVEFGNSSEKKDANSDTISTTLKHQLNCVTSINEDKFENIKAKIEEELMDKSKLKLAKELVNSECLKSAQVANIMELMNIDKYKVEFAKFAFGRTIDKENFARVKETLNFSTSKKQIEAMY